MAVTNIARIDGQDNRYVFLAAGVKIASATSIARYEIGLRIFSRARGVTQPENVVKDIYLVEATADASTRFSQVPKFR